MTFFAKHKLAEDLHFSINLCDSRNQDWLTQGRVHFKLYKIKLHFDIRKNKPYYVPAIEVSCFCSIIY
jgi:hypothetical protein